MKSISKLLIVGVTAISLTLAGCSSSKPEDAQRKKVAAEVNGEKILMGDFLDNYNAAKGSYNITSENENSPENKEMVTNLKKGILDDMVYRVLILQKAKEAGFTVNDEALKQSREKYNEMVKSIEDQMKAQPEAGDSAGTDYAAKAKKYVDEQLKAMGKTQDDYIKMMAERDISEQLMKKTVGEIQISDDEIKSWYDTQLLAQKGGAQAASEELDLYGEPSVTVKHILIQLPQDVQTQYNNLLTQSKTDEAKKYLDEKLKTIYPKAKGILDKVKAGQDFEKLMNEYGEDPGMKNNSEGYVVKKDGQFIPEFQDAAFKLKEGKVSGLVAGPYGYHIIKAYKVTGAKIATLEEKKDAIKKELSTEKTNEKWTSILDEWMKASKVVKHEDLL